MDKLHAADRFVGQAEGVLGNWDRLSGKGKSQTRFKEELQTTPQGGDGDPNQADPNAGTQDQNGSTPPDAVKAASTDDPSGPNHDWEKRAKDGQRYITQLKEAERLAQQKLDEANLQIEKLSKPQADLLDAATLEKYAKANPDNYKVILSLIAKEAEDIRKNFSKEFSKVEEVVKEVSTKEALKVVLDVHPDAIQVRDSDEFKTWYEDQSPGIKGLFAHSVTDVIEGLTLYKERTSKAKEAVDKQKAKEDKKKEDATSLKSSAPKTEGTEGPKFSESQVDAMSPSEFKQNRKAIEKAITDGTFIFDKSKRR